MVVGQRQRQHQARLEGLAVPYRLHGRLGHTEDRHFRRVDDRREAGAADVAETGDGEAGALHGIGRELLVAGLVGQLGGLGGQLQEALPVDIADHRDQQAVRSVHGEADVYVLLADQRLAAGGQRTVEVRQFLEQVGAGLEQDRQYGQLDPGLLRRGLLGNAEGFHVGDVRLVELGHVRHVQPAAMQVGGADLHQAGHRHFFHFAELAEVDFRDRRDAGSAGGAGTAGLGALQLLLDEDLDVFLEDATLGTAGFHFAQLDAELARQHAHRRAGVDLGAVAAGCADRSRGIGLGWRRGRRGGLLLGGGRRGLGRSGCRLLFGCRSGAFHLQLEDQVAGADFVTDLDRDAFHHAGGRRGDLHAGLVGFQGDQRLVGLDRVAGLDHHFDDVGLAGRADVRDLDVLDAGCGGGGRLALARGGSRRFGFRRFRLGGRCLGLGFGRLFAAFHFQLEDFVTFFQGVADLRLDAFHYPGLGTGDFHAGLVGFQGQQALIGLDLVAGLDQQLDDFTLTVADVGYANEFAHIPLLLRATTAVRRAKQRLLVLGSL